MKTFFEQLNRVPKIGYIVGATALVVIFSIPIILFMILPVFGDLNKVNLEIETQKQKVSEIKKTIAFLNSENKNKLTSYTKFFDQLIPGQLDMPHFASLNEVVSAAVGAEVKSITIVKGVPKKAQTQNPSASTGTAGSTPTASTTTTLVQKAPTTVNVTYNSNYDTLLNLIDFWRKADQLVGVSLVKANAESNGVLNYTIEYFLPVSESTTTKATIGEKIQFSQKEKDKIDELRSKIIYFATPSAQPLGKGNPFR